MIEIVGHRGGSEYAAALAFKEAIEQLWPKLANTPKNLDHIVISANVRISGYKVSDIDIVVAGQLSEGYSFKSSLIVKDKSGKPHLNAKVSVRNFVVAIEVKDQESSGVQRIGDDIQVFYPTGVSKGWKSATEQNDKQVYSLKNYFSDFGIDSVYVGRCLLMRGLPYLDAPGALHGGFTGIDFFSSISALHKLSKISEGLSLSASMDVDMRKLLLAPIFTPIVPSKLDRRRMDLLIKESAQTTALADLIGNKMAVLRGQGGSGKTLMMLQAAHKLYQEKASRVLVLTYNHTLAADIRRLLSLLGISSNPFEGGIVIKTVMSFMYSWFRFFGLLDTEQDLSYENYSELCLECAELINGGALSETEIIRALEDDPESYAFSYILVDEAQDWPEQEAMLLKSLYDPKNICLADGVDQLVRGNRTSWLDHMLKDEYEVIFLDKCLRMKRNISAFIKEVAAKSNVTWEMKLNDKAAGGRVLVLENSYTENLALHERLISGAKADGNSEVDFLFCVPPSAVFEKNGVKTSSISTFLKDSGIDCWDGVDPKIRKDFPRRKDEFRIVQYDSCRGLEGWTVVLEHLDDFWEYRYRQRMENGLTEEESLAYADISDVARKFAWSQVVMAMSRPIDTLVITIKNHNSETGKIISKISKNMNEIVNYVN